MLRNLEDFALFAFKKCLYSSVFDAVDSIMRSSSNRRFLSIFYKKANLEALKPL